MAATRPLSFVIQGLSYNIQTSTQQRPPPITNLHTQMGHAKRFGKAEYIGLMMTVLPAIPDFSWSAATTGAVADDGYCVVVVAVRLLKGVAVGGVLGGDQSGFG